MQSRTWGVAYHVVGSSLVTTCLERLGLRECHLGGYNLHLVTFTDADGSHAERLRAFVFIASPSNHLYLGPASVDELARQVMSRPACTRLKIMTIDCPVTKIVHLVVFTGFSYSSRSFFNCWTW